MEKDMGFIRPIENTEEAAKMAISKEDQLTVELCSIDILRFAKFCMIPTTNGLKQFELYPWQAKLLTELQVDPKSRHIVLGSRQSGKTYAISVFFLWKMLFHFDQILMIYAPTKKFATSIMWDIRYMYHNLPDYLRFELSYDSRERIQVKKNRSRILCSTLLSRGVHARPLDIVWMDEFAFCKGDSDREFIESALPCYSSRGIIITSGANGTDNEFYNLWRHSDGNGFKRTFVSWSELPGRDEDWKKRVISAIGEAAFSQEYENCFIKSVEGLKDVESIDP